MLDAEGGKSDLAGLGRQHEAHGQDAVLLAAFHDVAGLDENVFFAGVLDLQLVDLARFDDAHAALGECFLQSERHGPAALGPCTK